jgi:hypothetical protein
MSRHVMIGRRDLEGWADVWRSTVSTPCWSPVVSMSPDKAR